MKEREWILFRKRILARDENKCQKCGSTVKLVVHHIIPTEFPNIYNYNKLKMVTQNCITLCTSCHLGVGSHLYLKLSRDEYKDIEDIIEMLVLNDVYTPIEKYNFVKEFFYDLIEGLEINRYFNSHNRYYSGHKYWKNIRFYHDTGLDCNKLIFDLKQNLK